MGEVGQTGEGLEVQDFISRASRGSPTMLTQPRVFISPGREVHGFHQSFKEFQKVKNHRTSLTLSY